MAARRGKLVRAWAVALALVAGTVAVAPGVAPVAIAADPAAITGDQEVPNVGRSPETATLVSGGATIRSIYDPNRGQDRWFAIDLAEGDSLAVAVDAAAPGTVALTGSPVAASPVFVAVAAEPPGTTVETAGRYLVRYQGDPAAAAARYALTFTVTPTTTPRATLPPEGMLVCGAVDLSGRIAAAAPGTRVCPGAIVTSALSASHLDDVYALDLAWSDELTVATEGSGLTWTFAYPSDVTSATGPIWYPLAASQVASEPGTFLVRASLAPGVAAAPYTATFGVAPEGADAYALVQDIELAPGCVIKSGGEPLTQLPAMDGQTILLRVTDTDPAAQDLVIGPVDALASGAVATLDTVVTQPDITTSFGWQPAMSGVPWALGCLDASLVVRSTVPIVSAAPSPALVTVPDLTGLTLGKAAGALVAAGLAGGSPQTVPDAAPSGTVVRTDPAAGSQVPAGTVVTLVLSAGPAPSVVPTLPTRTMPPAPTLQPTPAPATPAPTPQPTPAPTPFNTPPPISSTATPKVPEPQAFACDGRTAIADPLRRGWRITQVFWAKKGDYDRVTLRLQPDTAREGKSRVVLETLTADELAAVLPGVAIGGDSAVTLRFTGPVSLTGDMSGSPTMGSLRSVLVTRDENGRPWAVVGAAGEGCSALTVTAWEDPSTQTTPFVDVTLDIQH